MVAAQASGGKGCDLDWRVSATAKTTLVIITLANIYWYVYILFMLSHLPQPYDVNIVSAISVLQIKKQTQRY